MDELLNTVVISKVTNKDLVILLVKSLIIMILGSLGIAGALLIILLHFATEWLVCTQYKCKPMTSGDRHFFYDEPENPCNLMSVLILDRASEEDLRATFQYQLPRNYERFRSKIVKVLDQYYF